MKLTALENGPIVLNGTVSIADESGKMVEARSAALCRCGQSSQAPFCDGSHAPSGFEATGHELEAQPTPARS